MSERFAEDCGRWGMMVVRCLLSILLLGLVVGCAGPGSEPLEITSPDGVLGVSITYPRTMRLGESADIVVTVENRGEVDWRFNGRDSAPSGWGAFVALDSSAAPAGQYYLDGLIITGSSCIEYYGATLQLDRLMLNDGAILTPRGDCSYLTSDDRSFAWIALASVGAGQSASGTIRVLASQTGAFHAAVAAFAGEGEPIKWGDHQLVTVVKEQ